MNSCCKVAISIGMMPLDLVVNNENCCFASLFVFCSIYSEVFVLTDYIKRKSFISINGAI